MNHTINKFFYQAGYVAGRVDAVAKTLRPKSSLKQRLASTCSNTKHAVARRLRHTATKLDGVL